MNSVVDNQLLAKRSDVTSLLVVTAHIAFVFCPVYLSAALGANFVLPFCWLWYGTSMHGLLNLMHECAHTHTFKRRSWCDFLGRWILAPLFFADFDNYRQLHWNHHRFIGEEGDPKYTYKINIEGRRFFIFLIECLSGIEAVKKFAYQINNRNKIKQANSHEWIFRIAIVQVTFFVSLMVASGCFIQQDMKTIWNALVAYFVVYIYGIVSLTLLMATLRAIAEHQNAMDEPEMVGLAALRNLHCGPVERLILGCYGFAEHATHHYSPSIPSYNLQRATKVLSNDHQYLIPRLTYSVLLRRIISPSVLD